jgi:hypothetical protein
MNAPGEWAAETEGYKAAVPPGGLTARMVKSVKPGAFLDKATDILRGMELTWGKDEVHKPGGVLNRQGFTRLSSQSVQRRGRPPEHDDLFYAGLARDYQRIMDGGNVRAPIKQLANERDYERATIRRLLNKARERGMLTHPPSTGGQAGGRLTQLAIDLLTAAGEETA